MTACHFYWPIQRQHRGHRYFGVGSTENGQKGLNPIAYAIGMRGHAQLAYDYSIALASWRDYSAVIFTAFYIVVVMFYFHSTIITWYSTVISYACLLVCPFVRCMVRWLYTHVCLWYLNKWPHAVAAQTARSRCKVLSIQYVYYFRAYQRQRTLHGVGVITQLNFAILGAFKESITLNLAQRSLKVIHFGRNRKPVCDFIYVVVNSSFRSIFNRF